MKVLTRVLLVILLFGLLFPTSAYPQSLRYEDMPLANPGFESTTVLGGQRVPVSWTSSLWGRTTPAVTGVSNADASSGTYSLYVMSVDQGSAGWTSGFLSVTEDVYEIKGSFKARKTTDYSGNMPWVFLSYWQDGTYLGTSTVAVTAGTAGWSPNSFQVNAGQFPSGTNKVRINLATSRVGQSGAIAGSVRYDDVVIQTGTLSDVIDIANPDFEQTYVSQGKMLPLNWTSALWNRTTPVDTAVTDSVYTQGNHSLYMAAADAGSAGWASQPIAVYGSPQSVKLTFDIKKSSNYVGNVAWAFISFWNNSTFIGTATVPVSGLSEAWSEQSLTLKGAQFPQGTNYMRINLATTRGGASGTLGGTLYYDNVQMKTVDDFSLTSSAFANWYKLGEDVVFKPENQLLPQSVQTVTGTVYDEEGQVIAQSTVNRQTLLSDGWSWEPERAGYYEIAFDYVKTGDTTPVAHFEAYTVTSAKGTAGQFVRNRYAVAVADGDTKAMSQRSPMFGFSYQLEGEQAVRLADKIGFSMARIHSVPWGTQFTNTTMALEPSRGTYNWTAFDAQVNMLRSYGFELAGNILFTPQWASSHPEDTQIYTAVPGYAAYAPADMEDLADFLRALIDRYGDRISKWEVWNEPHLPGGSIFWRDTPEKFVELLKTSYETIKEEQPESEVWIGGLGGRRYLPFYRELLRLGATSYYDKLALHGAFPNADYFKDLDDQYEAASKDWVTSESHAGLISSIGLTAVPSEKEIAFKILLDYLYQIKHGSEQIAYFEMMNQVETEALTFAKADGWHTHASGLFRKKPQIEPRLGAVALHRFLETAGQTVSYRGEYALSSVQNAVYLDNGGTPLTVLWLSGENEQVIDSRLAESFTPQTKIRDWTGRSYSASASLVLKPGRMYYIEQLDETKLGELPLSDEVLLSDYDKVRRSATIPVGAGQAGELFDHETGVLSTEPITWIENDWVFDSETGQTRPAGLDAKFAVGYTEDGIDLIVDVADAVFVQNESAGLYWRGDSLQFAIDTYGLGAPAEARMDFQAALTAEGPRLWKETTPYIGGDLPYNWTQQQQFVQHGQIHIDRTGTQTLYKIHLDWSELYPYVPQAGVPIYMSVLVNTNDGAGRIGWLEWGSGIGKSKDPSLYGKLMILNTDVDKSPPGDATIAADITATTNSDVTITVSYPADVAVKEYKIGANGAWIAYTAPVAVSGNSIVYARGTDAAGNVSNETSYTVSNIDHIAPVDATLAAGTTSPTNQGVTVTISYPADAAAKEYKVGASGTWTAYTAPVVVSENDTVYARGIDAVGNVSNVTSITVSNIYKIAPVTVATLSPGAPNGKNSWYTTDVTVSLSVSANVYGGAVTTEYQVNDGAWIAYTGSIPAYGDGTYKLGYRSKDQAGNVEQLKTVEFRVDKTVPALSVQLDKTSIWPANHKMVTVNATLNSSDATSGVASVVLTSITSNEPASDQGDIVADFGTADTSISLRAERSGKGTGRIYTITYTVTDNAGNQSTALNTVSVPHKKDDKDDKDDKDGKED